MRALTDHTGADAPRPSPRAERGRRSRVHSLADTSSAARLFSVPRPDPGGVPRPDSDGRPSAGEMAEAVRAQNAELQMRMRRLTPVLVSLARDLAIARREGAALQRENRRLRSHVESLEERAAGGHGQPAATRGESPARVRPNPCLSDGPADRAPRRQPLGARRKASTAAAIPPAITFWPAELSAIDPSKGSVM